MYEALFEDEDDIFGGTPRSKYMDIIYNANRNLAEEQLHDQMRIIAAMEHFLETHMGSEYMRDVQQFIWSNEEQIEARVKSLFIEFTGKILSNNE